MKIQILKLACAAACLSSALGAQAQANHLLLSEIGMNAGPNNEGEYIEIYNPTTSAVDLGNYWITDTNSYKNLPLTGSIGTGTSDNVVRFPAGTMLQSGQVAVIVGKSTTFITNYFDGQLSNFTGQDGSPLLFEVTESDATVPNVISASSTNPLGWNFTNAGETNGEFAVLFYWDGTADLVKDVDIVGWGHPPDNSNAFLPKKATDLGKNSTPYLDDAGSHNRNLTLGVVQIATRTSINEESEVQSGGNGISGQDESTEASSAGWVGGVFADTKTPGTSTLTVIGENVPPVIGHSDRSTHYPVASDTIILSANVTDDDTVASVRFMVNSGSGFIAVPAVSTGSGEWTAAVGPFPTDTIVRYYVEATDNDNAVSIAPVNAPDDTKLFVVNAAPLSPGTVVINEVMYDNPGGEAFEFVELYNTLNTPVNLAYFRFADGNRNYFNFPEGAEIPAKGYMVLTLGLEEFQAVFPPEANVQYYDWGTFGLNNGTDDLMLIGPNDFDFNNTITYTDWVRYSTEEPWPQGVNGTGASMELIHSALDNALPESWATAVPAATPGKANSVSSAFRITEVSRDIEFPTAGTAVTVTAKVEPLVEGTTIDQVRLLVDTGSGFTSITMAPSATAGVYAAAIPGQAEGARVKYYIEATNSASQNGTAPTNAPTFFNIYLVGATPVQTGDVAINEILYDNFGSDAYEFVELYNTLSESVDLSYFRLMDNQNKPFIFPEGTSIGPNNYIVVTMNSFAFRATYGEVPSLFSWEGVFGLANGGDTVKLIHPNQFNYSGSSTAIEEVVYTNTAPWPNWTVDEDHPNASGRSIELINPNYEDRGTNGERWAWTTKMVTNLPGESMVQGTPGAQNSVFSTASVDNWTLY